MAEQEQRNGGNETSARKAKEFAARPAPQSGASGRIICITAEILEMGAAAQRLRGMLEGENYEVVWASPSEVLYDRDEVVADAIILDATTIDIGALCERLKRGKQDDQPQTPLLALTAENADFKALATSGVDDFISEGASDTEIRARLFLAARLGQVQRDLHSAREDLHHQIQVDDLTGALNRRFFFQSAYRECSRARRYGQALSCLMVDINHFQLYNTSFSYGCGDFILREVATILKNSVRDTDLVARFSESKFVILLTHTDTEGASTVRLNIENRVKDGYFVWQHQRLPVTVSIGEAERVPGRSHPVVPEEGEEESMLLSTREDLAELLQDADSALYIAKKGARFPSFLEGQAEHTENQIV